MSYQIGQSLQLVLKEMNRSFGASVENIDSSFSVDGAVVPSERISFKRSVYNTVTRTGDTAL